MPTVEPRTNWRYWRPPIKGGHFRPGLQLWRPPSGDTPPKRCGEPALSDTQPRENGLFQRAPRVRWKGLDVRYGTTHGRTSGLSHIRLKVNV
jgi:hypothetical protein